MANRLEVDSALLGDAAKSVAEVEVAAGPVPVVDDVEEIGRDVGRGRNEPPVSGSDW
ncbi:hypothetical protein [Nocardia carnea]|uniref:hypothetical protein n=1 Tax=Nocardia carnea TaxID=37328 RepID=UPI002458ACD5|nr:hypothetical protein [Nocardia carnea]